MSTIWKEPIHVGAGTIRVRMPMGSEILAAGKQAGRLGEIAIWFRVPTGQMDWCEREIIVRGTGHPDVPDASKHIGTVFDGPLVWHVFDGGEVA